MNPQTGELLVQEVAPRIQSLMPSFVPIRADDPQELAQDEIAIAAALLMSAEARAKKVTAGNIAYYAVGLVRQGRRSSGQSTTDVMHPGTQITGRSQVMSLDESIAGETESDDLM